MGTLRGRLALTLLAGMFVVAACGTGASPAKPTIADAWVRPPMGEGRPAAGYMTIAGGGSADALIAAESPAAMKVEIHETYAGGSGMGMREVEKIDVPANGTVDLAPGGYHLMLMQPKVGAMTAGGTVQLTLTFEKAGKVTITAEVRQG